MKLLIDKTELELLLEKKKGSFKRNFDWAGTIFAGATFIISAFFADYPDKLSIPGTVFKTISILLGMAFMIWGIIMLVKSIKNKYNHIDLLADIRDLNEIQHPFSIVAVKDTFNKFPNRFLLYYDERWDCKFFFSYRTVDDNIANIKARLSHELNIPENKIDTKYFANRIDRKFSVSDQIVKTYNHALYQATISEFTEILKQDQFVIDGKKFFWMTIPEMERDPEIQKKNLDIVHFVQENIA